MSECNFCGNEKIKKEAKKKGLKVSYEKGMLGGKDVYVHPNGVDITTLSKVSKNKYWICWFMRLGKKCEC